MSTSLRPRFGALRAARPGNYLRRLADADAKGSFSNSRRSQRFEPFAQLVEQLKQRNQGPVRILDIGGTTAFWEHRGWAGRDDVEIVTINLEAEPATYANIESRAGDATNLAEFADGSFDVVFSNSVIEHLFSYDNQVAMAREVRRLASHYWVQTPNFWFPVEPHFLTPAWHWLPVGVRVALLRRRRWGWRGPCPDPAEARELVREVRIMRAKEIKRIFPDAELVSERIGPLTKSFVAVRSA